MRISDVQSVPTVHTCTVCSSHSLFHSSAGVDNALVTVDSFAGGVSNVVDSVISLSQSKITHDL